MVSPRRNQRVEELRAKIRIKGAAVRRLLDTPDGALVLDLLEAEFVNRPLLGKSPDETAFNVGRHDVVLYLKQLRESSQKEQADVDPLQ